MSSSRGVQRLTFGLAAGVLLAVAAIAVGSGGAAAANVCTGTGGIVISPGLTFTATVSSASTTTQFSTCTGTDPTVTRGSNSAALPVRERSCLDLLSSRSGTRVYSWDNGQTSTFAFTDSASYVAGNLVVVQTGSIVAGEFSGSSATATLTLSGNFLACLTTGVQQLSGPSVLTIV